MYSYINGCFRFTALALTLTVFLVKSACFLTIMTLILYNKNVLVITNTLNYNLKFKKKIIVDQWVEQKRDMVQIAPPPVPTQLMSILPHYE